MDVTLHGIEIFIAQALLVIGAIALFVWSCFKYKKASEREAEAKRLYDASKEADLKRMAAEFAFLSKVFAKSRRPVMTVNFETGEVQREKTLRCSQNDGKGEASCRD